MLVEHCPNAVPSLHEVMFSSHVPVVWLKYCPAGHPQSIGQELGDSEELHTLLPHDSVKLTRESCMQNPFSIHE